MNQWPKVSDEAKDAWASVLKRVDRSRLLVVARGGQNPVFRDRVIGQFAQRGIEAARIRVSPALDFLPFLELFSEIDISLDPFPYGGGTTTMQSLWMGVPVVTLKGASAFARNSVGLLSEVGLKQLVAMTPSAYVIAAAECAGNLAQLADRLIGRCGARFVLRRKTHCRRRASADEGNVTLDGACDRKSGTPSPF
jgi:predicted O-linked N-acetylglucosamine transferase (SPINDLY family)